VLRYVADLGNSRLKWARIDEAGNLAGRVAMSLDPSDWASAWSQLGLEGGEPSSWMISSVNPPVAARLGEFLRARKVPRVTWYQNACEVPIPYEVEGAEAGGADRALNVYAAVRIMPAGRPGLVVSCGTAITVERVTRSGVWQGGVIAPGLAPLASALHLRTAQVPLVDVRRFDRDHPPAPWGRGTLTSLDAGIFWGTVGMARELLARQSDDVQGEPWVIWTGGDGALLARFVCGDDVRIEPNLVLVGLAFLASAGTEHAG
jgi:type III pantothenate kinase